MERKLKSPSVLWLTAVAFSLGFFTVGSFGQSGRQIVISGGTLIDGTGRPPLVDAVVIIEGDRITRIGTASSVSIPQAARIIDAHGKFILPGLIDTHVHLENAGLSDIGEIPPTWRTASRSLELAAINAKLDLLAGFTTVRDLGSTDALFHLRDEIDAGKRVGARIIAAGPQLVKKTAKAGPESMFIEYDGPEDGRAKVRRLKTLGADVIKIRLTHQRSIPSLSEVQAIVNEAHRLGLRATVHTDVPADDLVKLAIDAGADGIEHNAPLRSRDSTILVQMASKGMSIMAGAGAFYLQRIDSTGLINRLDRAQTELLPNTIVLALRSGIDSLQRQTLQMRSSGWNPRQRHETFIAEMHRARSAGVLIAFGTDCGAYGMIHGEQYKALYGESQMGSSPMEVIEMATRDAAKALGKADKLGTIEVGKIADMLVVKGDPLADLRNLHEILYIVKAGHVYDPMNLRSSK